MDGYQLASRLREKFSAQRPRLIAMSGFAQQSPSADFSAYFMKPVDTQRLIDAIEES
jgi:hypothetical protein